MPAFGELPTLNAKDSINAGLLGFWPLAESAGSVSLDRGPFLRLGSFVNAPVRVASADGRAVSFTRTSSQYITVGTSLGVSTVAGFTFSARVYLGSSSDYGCIFKLGNITVGDGDGFSFGVGGPDYVNSGNNFAILYEGVGWTFPGVAVGFGWRELTFVLSNSAQDIKIYNNGVQVYSTTRSAPLAVGSVGSSIARLGGYFDTPSSQNRHFNGVLRTARVWNRALLPNEIQRLYADPWAGVGARRRPVRTTNTAVTLAISPLAYQYGAQSVGLNVGRMMGVSPQAYQYGAQAVGLSGSVVSGAGGINRTRRGARRIYLPIPEEPDIVMPTNIVRADNDLPDDDEDAWILLA